MQPEQHYAGDPLAGLQEIPLPLPVPYVPQTIGWAVIGAALLLALIYMSWRVLRHWRANAYRREALAELAAIELSDDPAGWGALPALLKRTAIAATSREQVAALTGDDWLRFLDRSLGSAGFNSSSGKLLTRIAYATSMPDDISRDELHSLIALSRHWIRRHHADV